MKTIFGLDLPPRDHVSLGWIGRTVSLSPRHQDLISTKHRMVKSQNIACVTTKVEVGNGLNSHEQGLKSC
jgi:hypothetical protein